MMDAVLELLAGSDVSSGLREAFGTSLGTVPAPLLRYELVAPPATLLPPVQRLFEVLRAQCLPTDDVVARILDADPKQATVALVSFVMHRNAIARFDVVILEKDRLRALLRLLHDHGSRKIPGLFWATSAQLATRLRPDSRQGLMALSVAWLTAFDQDASAILWSAHNARHVPWRESRAIEALYSSGRVFGIPVFLAEVGPENSEAFFGELVKLWRWSDL
jgi:hypothetical protein